MHRPTDRIAHARAFVTPVVEHELEQEIGLWVHREWSIRQPMWMLNHGATSRPTYIGWQLLLNTSRFLCVMTWPLKTFILQSKGGEGRDKNYSLVKTNVYIYTVEGMSQIYHHNLMYGLEIAGMFSNSLLWMYTLSWPGLIEFICFMPYDL